MSYRGILLHTCCLCLMAQLGCSSKREGNGSTAGMSGMAGSGGDAGAGNGGEGGTAGGPPIAGIGGRPDGGGGECTPRTCAELGWACGYAVDRCDNVIDCAAEGLSCSPVEICMNGAEGRTECVSGFDGPCDACSAVPDCSNEPQRTRLAGRVVTPGRADADAANQLGVPNATVYILRSNDPALLPEIATGIPEDGTACDRCDDQELGPVLVGAITDATGRFELEGHIPVGVEFMLVVRAGKFRRAVRYTLPAAAACQTTELVDTLPDNPTRLPRSMDDGFGVHLPRIAITTGRIDAMECVFEKMGIAHAEFSNPGASGDAAARIHLYRGGANSGNPPGSGARIDNDTPHDSALYGDLARLRNYDMVVANCEGGHWDDDFSERDAHGERVREYVNRGGRMFASHLSFSWLHENGTEPFSEADPVATGLGPAATWEHSSINTNNSGTGRISLERPLASPRIESFAAWMSHEDIASAPEYTFPIIEPRSQNTGLGEHSEEFVVRQGGNGRVQQFSFNTPYGAPDEAACGRVAYSGFHVSAGDGNSPFQSSIFPAHCSGNLTDQEKVLLYMLFDLGACVGEPPDVPDCTPETCESEPNRCGLIPDGCGEVIDCGPCVILG